VQPQALERLPLLYDSTVKEMILLGQKAYHADTATMVANTLAVPGER
tara:strand:+ start:1385 stop:1525 length:141 start_codon:yes stop_codon:yes gene_type:complete